MKNDDLMHIALDPDLLTREAARSLLELAKSVSGSDDDIAGDVVVYLTELLRPGGRVREGMKGHPNPPAYLTAAAKYEASHSRERAGRMKRQMPLAPDGDLAGIEPLPTLYRTSTSLFDLLDDLGWTRTHLQTLATPRQRAGRSVHPGIEAGLEKLARCFGVIERCPGCPNTFDLLRVDLLGPSSWPALVPVLKEWNWSDELIAHITSTPTNVAHWRDAEHRPPLRQERRMVEIARRMRWEPWLLQDSEAVRDIARRPHLRVAVPPAAPPPAVVRCAVAS